jgi:hypothetical protein
MVIFCGLKKSLKRSFSAAGIIAKIGAKNICATLAEATARASRRLSMSPHFEEGDWVDSDTDSSAFSDDGDSTE